MGKNEETFYWDSPFYYGMFVWRKRLAASGALLIIILILHGKTEPAIPDLWFWTGIIFGFVFAVCYLKMWNYERCLLESVGPLRNNVIIGVSNFVSLEKRHAKWYFKQFKELPPKTNYWR